MLDRNPQEIFSEQSSTDRIYKQKAFFSPRTLTQEIN